MTKVRVSSVGVKAIDVSWRVCGMKLHQAMHVPDPAPRLRPPRPSGPSQPSSSTLEPRRPTPHPGPPAQSRVRASRDANTLRTCRCVLLMMSLREEDQRKRNDFGRWGDADHGEPRGSVQRSWGVWMKRHTAILARHATSVIVPGHLSGTYASPVERRAVAMSCAAAGRARTQARASLRGAISPPRERPLVRACG